MEQNNSSQSVNSTSFFVIPNITILIFAIYGIGLTLIIGGILGFFYSNIWGEEITKLPLICNKILSVLSVLGGILCFWLMFLAKRATRKQPNQ